MRPIRLKISAFGPFIKPVELNFSEGLQGEKIFLIHGATGAGKTSILDAICYALYDESSGKDRKIADMRSEQATEKDKTEVEFEFALGEKVIKIRRNPKHIFPKGVADIKKSVEIHENGKLKITDNREATRYVEKLLGFEAEQFRQVVMLPQGKFRDFLFADSVQRSEILNVIFDATKYENFEKMLKERANFFESEFNILNMERINCLKEVAEILQIEELEEKNLPGYLSEMQKNLQAIQKSVEDLKKESEKANEELSVGKILTKDFERVEILEKNLEIFHNELEKISISAAIAEKEFQNRKAEEPQRKELEKQIEKLKEFQTRIKELQAKEAELKEVEKAEQNAQDEVANLNRSIKKCEEELEKIKLNIEKLQGADVKLKEIEQVQEKSKQRQQKLSELSELKKECPILQKNFETAEKNCSKMQTELNRLNLLLKMSAAAKLAENLQEGEPCPVCGALNHPQLAFTKEIIPSEKEITDVEENLKKANDYRDKALKNFTEIQAKITAKENELKAFGDVMEFAEAKKILQNAQKSAKELEENRLRLPKGEEVTKKKISDRDEAIKKFQGITKLAENLRGVIKAKKSQMPEEYLTASQKLSTDLAKIQKKLSEMNNAWKLAEENFHRLDKMRSAQESKIKNEEQAKADATQKIFGKEKPRIDELNKNAKTVAENYSKTLSESTRLDTKLTQLKRFSNRLTELAEKILSAEKNTNIWTRLANVASGKNLSKISFQRYYLNSMFKDIVLESNERLEKMSGGRYRFKEMETAKSGKRSAGLDLEIFDAYTGKARPVETLSGGESFLASLSLALGLANVVKNTSGGINLDTIFIDEGFGTLDSETLDTAINTLENLQSDGRVVGIISHVDELKQRIPARLEVTKTRTGSSAKFITK